MSMTSRFPGRLSATGSSMPREAASRSSTLTINRGFGSSSSKSSMRGENPAGHGYEFSRLRTCGADRSCGEAEMLKRGKRATGHEKVAELMSQAKRARQMAAECGSSLVAELFEVHALMCERNAR